MELRLTARAQSDLDALDGSIQAIFIKHMEKIASIPLRRHLRFGLPFQVDEVGQGRIVYQIENGIIYVLRCFPIHKEYEKWYKTFR